MISSIDLVCFGLVAGINGEQVELFDEEVCFLRYGLRSDGIGQVPSAGAKTLACN